MLLEQLIIEGFLSYRLRQTINLSDVTTCLVLGQINGDSELSNGSGKSSLFEAILVCFFGKGSGRADLLDSYINDCMIKMYLEVIFRIDNQRYKTVRSKIKASSAVFEIYLDSTNKDLKDATWKKTDKTIEDILGLSAKTYCSTIYLNERESLQVITGTSSERKEILRELLNINVFESAAKRCNKTFDDYDKKVQVNFSLIKDKQIQLEQEDDLKKKLELVETELKEVKKNLKLQEKVLKDTNEKKKQIEISISTQKSVKDQIAVVLKDVSEKTGTKKSCQVEIDEITKEIEDQKKAYSRSKTEIEEESKNVFVLEKSIKENEKKLKELDKVDKELKETTKLIKEKTEQKTELEKQNVALVAEYKRLQQFIAKLDGFKSACPVTEMECPVLNPKYKEELKKIKQNIIEAISLDCDVLKKKIEDIIKEIKDLSKKEIELENKSETRQDVNESLSKFKLKLQTIENNKSRFAEKEKEYNEYLKSSDEDIKSNKQKIVDIDRILTDLNNSIKELEGKLDSTLDQKLKIVSDEKDEIEEEIVEIRADLETKNQKLGEIKSSLEKLVKLKTEIEHLSKNNEENAKQMKIHQILSTEFGKDGIQKAIMKESIPLLEQYTSDFLKIFNNDSEKIKVKFDLDPKKQDGEFKKGGGLDILVLEDGKEPKDLQMYSGGETVRIVFSIVLSLAKLLSLRAGKKHETLIIDEKIAKLDVRGIEQFGEVIAEITKIYKQVFVITHIETLKDLINGNEIMINKTEQEGSVVSVS
jgi:exonuclease SbcC